MKPNIEATPDFTDFERALRLQPTKRLHQFDFNIHPDIKQAVLGREIKNGKDELEFWQSAGYDYVQVRLKPKRAEIHHSAAQATSHGSLQSLEQLRKGGFEWSPFHMGTWNLDDYNWEFICEIAENLPGNMKLLLHAADIFTRSWMAMGFEDFCYALYENEELVQELFYQNYVEEQALLDALFDRVGDKIGAVLYSDDIAYTEGLLVNASVYRTYLFPYVKKLLQKARHHNLPIIYHTDGQFWDVFDDLKAMGVNGIQPLEPKSFDLTELKEKKGSDFCLMGSIDIDVLARGSQQAVKELVYANTRILGRNGGFVIGASNTVPEYIKVENYIAMIETARTLSPDGCIRSAENAAMEPYDRFPAR